MRAVRPAAHFAILTALPRRGFIKKHSEAHRPDGLCVYGVGSAQGVSGQTDTIHRRFPPGWHQRHRGPRGRAEAFRKSDSRSSSTPRGANTAIASEMFVRMPPDGYYDHAQARGTPPIGAAEAQLHTPSPTSRSSRWSRSRRTCWWFIVSAREEREGVIAISKKHPREINYGSSGIGTTVHLSAELFQYITGINGCKSL